MGAATREWARDTAEHLRIFVETLENALFGQIAEHFESSEALPQPAALGIPVSNDNSHLGPLSPEPFTIGKRC